MERPGHFQADDDYFQDDRYKQPLWSGWGNDTRGKYYRQKQEQWCIWWYLKTEVNI